MKKEKFNIKIERNFLRLNSKGKITTAVYPKVFGNKEKNNFIGIDTEDYILKVKTPICQSISDAFNKLEEITNVVYVELYNLKEIIENSERKEIAVGGEFAYSYLVEEYGLNFVTVYTNCGEGEDPSITKVKSVIDYINNHKIPAVYNEELSVGTVAKMIAEETEAEPLVLYSIHNGNPEEDTYVSLMNKNIENLEKGMKPVIETEKKNRKRNIQAKEGITMENSIHVKENTTEISDNGENELSL